MYSTLLLMFALSVNPAAPIEAGVFPAGIGVVAPMTVSEGSAWYRPFRHPRLLQPNRLYYQSHSYDPRLQFDYPWHPPRVHTHACPMVPSVLPDTALEF